MTLELTTKIRKDELYDFTIYSLYSKVNGFLMIVLGMAVIFIGLFNKFYLNSPNWKFMSFIILGLLVIAYTPILTKFRISRMPDNAEIFSTNNYVFSDVGIKINDRTINWEDVSRYVSTPKNIGLYFSDGVIIMPKRYLLNEFDKFNRIIISNINIDNVVFS